MAEGLKPPTITQVEMTDTDILQAEQIARKLGYEQFVYTSTSALWGLFCLPENPAHAIAWPTEKRRALPPFVHGCVIKTREFGLMFVQTQEDLGFGVWKG